MESLDVHQAAEAIENTLDRLDHAGAATMSDSQLIDAMTRMRRLAARMEAEAAVWTSAAAVATGRATGTPLADYLAATEGRTSREAQGVVRQASRITSDTQVAAAALSGDVPPDKAAAIGGVLRQMPADRMTRGQRQAAAAELIAEASGSTTRQIARSGDRILDHVAPELAPSRADRAALLEHQRRRALADRALILGPEQDGALRFWGQLPTLEAAQLRLAIQACVERGRRDESDQAKALREQHSSGDLSDAGYLAAREELSSRQARSTGQRQADALCDMARVLTDLGQVPRTAGEPARLVITLDHQQLAEMAAAAASNGVRPDGSPIDQPSLHRLRAGLTGPGDAVDGSDASEGICAGAKAETARPGAGADRIRRPRGDAGQSAGEELRTAEQPQAAPDTESDTRWPVPILGCLETGEQIPASALRLLCCDADLLPAVLGADSAILDVGRTKRLVTTPIRQALRLRDRHCRFPGCTVPAALCQAHHVVPWWAGGKTCVNNMVGLCSHHHGVVEPDRFNPAADQWAISFDDHHMPHLTPPRRLARRLPAVEAPEQDSARRPVVDGEPSQDALLL